MFFPAVNLDHVNQFYAEYQSIRYAVMTSLTTAILDINNPQLNEIPTPFSNHPTSVPIFLIPHTGG